MVIAAVLEHYGADLTRVREVGWASLRCPFHDDTHASARVNLDRGAFKCHGCPVKGDAIKLIMLKEGLGYRGALEWSQEVLGQSVGDLPRAAPEPRQKSQWRDQLFQESRNP